MAAGPDHRRPSMTPAIAAASAEMLAKLRAELAIVTLRPRQARLLNEIGEVEERAGDEPGAARDYLAAFNADPQFREPLEGLVRLLERRRSLRNLGKLIDALVRASETPEEKARSLLMKAAFEEDVSNDIQAAKATAREALATGVEGPERTLAWLTLEVIAGKVRDPALRIEALVERGKASGDPTWRGLLLLDGARVLAAGGEVDPALALLEDARQLRGAASYEGTVLAARFIRHDPGTPGSSEAKARARAYASALEAQADLVHFSTLDAAGGDLLGVPRWVRDTPHMVDAWLRAADAHRSTGEIATAAAVLDRAEKSLLAAPSGTTGLAEIALSSARLRIADSMGDRAGAARLAESRLATEEDPGVSATLALRIAQEALRTGDTTRALEALTRALVQDPMSAPARALQLDVLADGNDPTALAAELEAFAEHLDTESARSRIYLLAAFVWGMLAGDIEGARAAISQAGLYGASPGTLTRLSRTMAAYRDDVEWRDEATRRLIVNGADASELRALWFELIRGRLARGDRDGAAKAMRELANAPKGAWLARLLEAFLPGAPGENGERRRAALNELARMDSDPARARGLAVASAARAQRDGDAETARADLRLIARAEPRSALVASFLADLERAAGAPERAAEAAMACAEATDDPQLAAALFFEAGFDKWRAGDRAGAAEAFEKGSEGAPLPALSLLAWCSRGLDVDSPEGRRRAITRAIEAGEDANIMALERFGVELADGAEEEAGRVLDTIEDEADNHLLAAGDLARIAWEGGARNLEALRAAIGRIGALGERTHTLAAAEQLRVARAFDPSAVADAARAWFDAGGGVPAALEWLGATMGTDDEVETRRLTASLFQGPAREAMLASASLLDLLLHPQPEEVHFIEGDSPAVRLVNLELAMPGCNPRDRARALLGVGPTFGADFELDTVALSGWSFLASGDAENATQAFSNATKARPNDIAAWAGLHAAAEAVADATTRAFAAEQIGLLSTDSARGAKFLEEAGLLLLEAREGDRAEELFEAAFERDPSRGVAFDKLFRRVREKKEGDRLLSLIEKRLDASDDPTEIVKLYWERARVLREHGDADGALVALDNVTLVEPDHVGALALSGEIFIRKERYQEAAEALGRLAKIEAAPAKNRVTAGIAAVDLYENKLQRFDLALEVLLALHKAKLSSMAVRERLARAAARAGAWTEATAILEELMKDRTTPEGRIEAAQLAMAIHRDRLNDPNGAIPAIIQLLGESPKNGDAIDLLLVADADPVAKRDLLTRARAAIVDGLADEPLGGVVVERLARVAAALSDDALEHAALTAALALGGARDDSWLRVTQLARGPRFPQTALALPMIRNLASAGDEGPIAELFMVMGPTLAEALGPTLGTAGVGKRDRVDARSGLPLRNEIAAWAGAFGIQEFELYVGGKDATGVQGIPGEPVSIVVGPGINSPLAVPVRARVARELYAVSRGTTTVRLRDETTVAAIVIAACKLAEVRMEAPTYAVQAEIDKLVSKSISRKTKKLLPDICQRIAQSRVDARAWARRALASQDRIAALASGDVAIVLSEALGHPVDRLPEHVRGDARAEELLRFVLSKSYLELRRSLGLEEAP
jgi:cellulose synthase operon protein C